MRRGNSFGLFADTQVSSLEGIFVELEMTAGVICFSSSLCITPILAQCPIGWVLQSLSNSCPVVLWPAGAKALVQQSLDCSTLVSTAVGLSELRLPDTRITDTWYWDLNVVSQTFTFQVTKMFCCVAEYGHASRSSPVTSCSRKTFRSGKDHYSLFPTRGMSGVHPSIFSTSNMPIAVVCKI